MLPPFRNDRELELVRRVSAGDRAAAAELFEDHVDELYEFVHWRVGADRALAEDVVQDTFLVALERLGDYRGDAPLESWLRGIARHRISHGRRRRKPRALEDVLAEADSRIDAILAEVEREPLPDWVLEQRETDELVGATLSSLPADYRQALVGKYCDGLSVAQLAERDGRGEKAVESMLHRARRAFAKVFSMLAKDRGGLT